MVHLFVFIVSLLVGGCGLFGASEDDGPRRGGGTDFDDELDAVTSPLHGIVLCTKDGPCGTRDRRARGTILSGQPEGEWTLFGPRGVRVGHGLMKAGQAHGLWKRWNAEGTLVEEGRWADGKPHGVWRMYRDDGSLFEQLSFAEGLRHGPWMMAHPNGQVAEHMVWEKGRQVGLQTDYAADGARLGRGQFEDHQPVGEWLCWDADGTRRSIAAPGRRLTPAQACGHPTGE